MSGNIDSEQWQNFNERLSYWISKQGFWFQLRYSLFLGGKKSGLMFHFVHLALRLVIFLIAGGGPLEIQIKTLIQESDLKNKEIETNEKKLKLTIKDCQFIKVLIIDSRVWEKGHSARFRWFA